MLFGAMRHFRGDGEVMVKVKVSSRLPHVNTATQHVIARQT